MAKAKTSDKIEAPREMIEDDLTPHELEIIDGGSNIAGAGKITFNPFSITRKID